YPGKNVDLLKIIEGLVGESLNIRSLRDVSRMLADADNSRDTTGGCNVVSCNHNHTDSGSPAVTDSIRNVSTRRILQADKAEERQILIGCGVGVLLPFIGTGQHAQALAREFLGALSP